MEQYRLGRHMALIQLSSESKVSLVEQIVEQLKKLVDKGSLRAGTKAASIRLFARQHMVSVHTVAEAYERLVAQGYFESRPRSGFFIRRPHTLHEKRNPTEKFAKAFDHLWQLRSHLTNEDGLLNVTSGKLPSEWMDTDMIKASLKSVAAKIDSGLLQYGDPYGYLPLRVLLQSRLSDLGIHSQLDQMLLTTGASQAVDLIIRYLLRQGDKVMVDDPGYFNLFSNLQMQGIEPLPVRRNHDGPDLDMVEKLAQQHRPSVMFTQSVLQTPTGSTISAVMRIACCACPSNMISALSRTIPTLTCCRNRCRALRRWISCRACFMSAAFPRRCRYRRGSALLPHRPMRSETWPT